MANIAGNPNFQVRAMIAPHYEYVNFLLKLGANPNISISANQTALDVVEENIQELKVNLAIFQTKNDKIQLDLFNDLLELIKSHGGKKFSELNP